MTINKEYNFKYNLNEEIEDIITRLKKEYKYFKKQKILILGNGLYLNNKLFNKKIIIGDNILNLDKNSKYSDIIQQNKLNNYFIDFYTFFKNNVVEVIDKYIKLDEIRKNYLARFSNKESLNCSYSDLFKYRFLNYGDRLVIKDKLFKVYKDNLISTIDEKNIFTYNEACRHIYNNPMNAWNTVKIIISTEKINLNNNLLKNIKKYNNEEENKIKLIQKIIADEYSISINNILDRSKYNSSDIEARQVGIYLSRKLTKNTLNTISKMFNREYHTTVIGAIRKVKYKSEISNDFKSFIYKLENKITKQLDKNKFLKNINNDIYFNLERR